MPYKNDRRVYTLNSKWMVLQYCALYKINMQAFRIRIALKAATSWPIAFFVREQNTGSALSFSVPTQPEGYVKLLNHNRYYNL